MDRPIAPPLGSESPRFAGPATFMRAPRIDDPSRVDVALVGVPFDLAVGYRPGTRWRWACASGSTGGCAQASAACRRSPPRLRLPEAFLSSRTP